MRFRAVLYSTGSIHMVCVIVSSIAAISSVAKSIREGYKCTVFQTLAAASSFLDGFGLFGEDIEIVATFYSLDGHNFDLCRCVDSFVGLF
jgi:hypothetical protein